MLWGGKEVVDEVDLAGFLLGRGMVFENRGDGDGEGIQAADLLGQFEGCEVELRLTVGAGEEDDAVAREGLETVDGEVGWVDIGEPRERRVDEGEDDGSAWRRNQGDLGLGRQEMLAEEAVARHDVSGERWLSAAE